MKRLRELERNWWENIINTCEEAANREDMGTIYSTLRTLGTRDSKPITGTTITTDDFSDHLSNVSKDRYEIDPGLLMGAVREMTHMRGDATYEEANRILNTTTTRYEVSEAMEEVINSTRQRWRTDEIHPEGGCHDERNDHRHGPPDVQRKSRQMGTFAEDRKNHPTIQERRQEQRQQLQRCLPPPHD